jgi:hypothetical protein
MPPIPPDGDICRYCDEADGFIAASLVDWRAFFVVRDLARWCDLDAEEAATNQEAQTTGLGGVGSTATVWLAMGGV